MMYAKLALRNVKRSAKDYLIYVITLILSVGLFMGSCLLQALIIMNHCLLKSIWKY